VEYGKGLLFEAVAKTYLITLSSLVALNLRALGGYDLRILLNMIRKTSGLRVLISYQFAQTPLVV